MVKIWTNKLIQEGEYVSDNTKATISEFTAYLYKLGGYLFDSGLLFLSLLAGQ